MSKEIWKETRDLMGVRLTMSLLYDGSNLTLKGAGTGYGCSGEFQRPVHGDTDWNGKVSSCAGRDVFGYYQIRAFRRTPSFVSFELKVWGALSTTPWLPPGGLFFKAHGPLVALETAAAVREYLENGYAADLGEHGFDVGVPAGAPGEAELVPA